MKKVKKVFSLNVKTTSNMIDSLDLNLYVNILRKNMMLNILVLELSL